MRSAPKAPGLSALPQCPTDGGVKLEHPMSNISQVVGCEPVGHEYRQWPASRGAVAERHDHRSDARGLYRDGVYTINDSGLVVGAISSSSDSGSYRAFYWQNGVLTVIDPSVCPLCGSGSLARDVNQAGVIAIESRHGHQRKDCELYLFNGELTTLPGDGGRHCREQTWARPPAISSTGTPCCGTPTQVTTNLVATCGVWHLSRGAHRCPQEGDVDRPWRRRYQRADGDVCALRRHGGRGDHRRERRLRRWDPSSLTLATPPRHYPGALQERGVRWRRSVSIASSGDADVTITRATPVVSLAGSGTQSRTARRLIGAAQLNASADVPGTFAYSPAARRGCWRWGRTRWR